MSIEQFRQLGYKTESVELTAETLIAGDYDTFWENPIIKRESGFNERRPARASFSPLQAVGGAFFGSVSGTFEPRPSGADGTPPKWFQLAAASGGVVAGDVVTWGAESASSSVLGTACTFKSRDGDHEHVIAGARMSKMRFYATRGERWLCDVEGKGRYTYSAQSGFVAAAHPSAGSGLPFLGLACSIGAFAGAIAEAEIEISGTVSLIEDGGHASGNGASRITAQSLMGRFVVQADSSVDWRAKARNASAGDVLAISCPMSAGAAGNVLTWAGNLYLSEEPELTYREGIGYISLVGEFFTTGAAAALTLTQS